VASGLTPRGGEYLQGTDAQALTEGLRFMSPAAGPHLAGFTWTGRGVLSISPTL